MKKALAEWLDKRLSYSAWWHWKAYKIRAQFLGWKTAPDPKPEPLKGD